VNREFAFGFNLGESTHLGNAVLPERPGWHCTESQCLRSALNGWVRAPVAMFTFGFKWVCESAWCVRASSTPNPGSLSCNVNCVFTFGFNMRGLLACYVRLTGAIQNKPVQTGTFCI